VDALAASDWPKANGDAERDRSTAETFRRERARLRHVVCQRVPDAAEAEDILQEVFLELVETALLVEPAEQVGA
jgi:DNA-directed RNA polymerase specialized sigma24 family protein